MRADDFRRSRRQLLARGLQERMPWRWWTTFGRWCWKTWWARRCGGSYHSTAPIHLEIETKLRRFDRRFGAGATAAHARSFNAALLNERDRQRRALVVARQHLEAVLEGRAMEVPPTPP